jgi:hypothetical protein
VPAILAFTGMFICCRRVIYKSHRIQEASRIRSLSQG